MASEVLDALALLAEPEERVAAAERLARLLGVESAMFFVRDPELHVLLPPAGLPQTVPGGPRWRAFLKSCVAAGRYEAPVDCPPQQERHAVAVVERDVALVMFGAVPDAAALAELRAALPLVSAVFAAEHSARLAHGQAAVARTTGRRAHDLALALDAARSDVERALEESARLNEKLQADDRRKDEFLAMLSHELRNPMAAIGAALEVMRGSRDERSDRAREIVERQAAQLTRLVDDLLDVARVTRGKIELRLAVVDVSTVLVRAVESIRAIASARGHTVEVSAPAPVHAQVDPARLEQMITNLLTNAVRYTEPGGRISTSVERDGANVIVRVRDSGIGISEAMLSSIFDPFVQVAPTIDRGLGGLGIGLTLVRRLAELHGGAVHAESKLGVGSVFTLRLAATDRPPLVKASPSTVPSARKRRVLVVDDNADSAEMIVMMLGMWGHEGAHAADGPAALAMAAALRPDLVLLDIGLPGMDGYEVARRMRAGVRTRDARIIALSGYGHESDRQLSHEAGCDGHLVKPVDLAALRQSVEST